MERGKLIYIIYLTSIILATFYLLAKIFQNELTSSTAFRVVEIPSLQIGSEYSCPCKKVGEELPHCPQNYIKIINDEGIFRRILVPNSSGIFDGVYICLPATTVKINSYGLRDYEYSIEKPPNTYRIIVLGDSHTFGHGVELNETYVKVLENLLNMNKKEWKYEVINFGVPGYSMEEKVTLFKTKGLSLNPDLVILQYLSDDLINITEILEIQKELESNYMQEHKLLDLNTRIQLFQLATEIWLSHVTQKNWRDVWDKNAGNFLKELAELCKENNIKVVLLFLSGNEKEMRLLEQFAAENNWIMIKLTSFNSPKYFLNEKDKHYNALGHKLIAEGIYRELVSFGILPE